MTSLTYGLALSASPYVSKEQSAKKLDSQATAPQWEGKKWEDKKQNKEKKVLHCGQEGIKETGDIDWRQRKSQEEKTVEQEEIVAWQPVTLSDDTLPTVLGTVNKCVCVKCYGERSV